MSVTSSPTLPRHDVTQQRTMEDKIIVAVCSYPVLYDTAAPFYRDRSSKVQAWLRVSQEVGLPVEVCRKKWKGLRDVYIREKKKEGEKRSDSSGEPVKRWRFSAIMSFLDPFVRLSNDNMAQGVEEDMAAEGSIDGHVDVGDEAALAAVAATATAAATAATAATAAATAATATATAASAAAMAASAAAAAAKAAAAAAGIKSGAINDQFSSDSDGAAPASSTVIPVLPITPSGSQRRKRRKVKLEDETEPDADSQREERIEQLLEQSLRAPPQSEEELFLLSLVPSLQRLPAHRKDYIKLQMCKIIHEESSTHDMKFVE